MARLRIRDHPRSLSIREGEFADLLVWLALCAAGLWITVMAVSSGADLGTDAPPFLGFYRAEAPGAAIATPLVAIAVLLLCTRRFSARLHWRAVLFTSYIASLMWMLSLAMWRGASGFTRYISNADGYTPDVADMASITDILASINDPSHPGSTAAIGHPPGPVILLWCLTSTGMSDNSITLVWIALAALTVPFALITARSMCGAPAARQLAPAFILAPYAVWMATGPDAITAVLSAASLAVAAHASHQTRSGWKAASAAVVAGILLAAATLFSYVAGWIALSILCLNFARRRPWHNLATGVAALLPLAIVQAAGFDWAKGLGVAYHGFLNRVDVGRSLWWWLPLSLTVLLVACGPTIVTSIRKCRNTPAWPLLVGPCAALLFSGVMGIARGGVEETWLAFFPWLTIAATAPARPAGPPGRAPLRLAAAGTVTAISVQAVLVSPW